MLQIFENGMLQKEMIQTIAHREELFKKRVTNGREALSGSTGTPGHAVERHCIGMRRSVFTGDAF